MMAAASGLVDTNEKKIISNVVYKLPRAFYVVAQIIIFYFIIDVPGLRGTLTRCDTNSVHFVALGMRPVEYYNLFKGE